MMNPISEELACTVCMVTYSEGRNAPVMLPVCGHTFCRSCLSNMRASCLNCPTCRTPHQQLDVDALPVNFAQMTLVDKLKKIPNSDLPRCYKHELPLQLWCRMQSRQICAMCFFEETKDKQDRFVPIAESHSGEPKVKTLERRGLILSRLYLGLKNSLSADLTNAKNLYSKILEDFMTIPGDRDFFSVARKMDSIISIQPTEGATGTPDGCRDPSLRCEAVEVDGRAGKLTWEDGQLHLYALGKELIDAHITVKMADVRCLIPPWEPSVFLDLADEDAIPLGRVVIRLWGSMRRAQQFLALCDGRLGPTFKGSNFVEINTESNCRVLVGGNYMTPSGETSSEGLMEDLEWGGQYEQQVRRGLVASYSFEESAMETRFGISLADNTNNFYCPFGEVVSDMFAVDAAARRRPVTKVKIVDVGVVISTFVFEDQGP